MSNFEGMYVVALVRGSCSMLTLAVMIDGSIRSGGFPLGRAMLTSMAEARAADKPYLIPI